MTHTDLSHLVTVESLDEFLMQELDYDLEFFGRMFEIFRGFVRELSSLQAEQVQDVKMMAHKMRSSCRSFGATALEQKLQTLEYNEFTEHEMQEVQDVAKQTEEAIDFYYQNKKKEAAKGA